MACSTRHDNKGKMAGSYSRVVLTSGQISLFPKRRCMRLRPRFWLWAERESHKVPLRLFDQMTSGRRGATRPRGQHPGQVLCCTWTQREIKKGMGESSGGGCWGCRKVSCQVLGCVQCLLLFLGGVERNFTGTLASREPWGGPHFVRRSENRKKWRLGMSPSDWSEFKMGRKMGDWANHMVASPFLFAPTRRCGLLGFQVVIALFLSLFSSFRFSDLALRLLRCTRCSRQQTRNVTDSVGNAVSL